MVIYKIQNTVNGKVYIGQTKRDLSLRIKEHLNAAKSGKDFYIGNAINKYGWSNFEVSVLAKASSIDELNRLERKYIEEYRSDEIGYNLSPGGEVNTMYSSKVKKKHDDVMRSEDVRRKISKTLSYRIKSEGRTDEYVKNMREGFRKYVNSPKFKEDCKKRKLSPEHFRALNDAKNKEVYCINESGEVVEEFKRVKDAANWWLQNGYKVKSYDQLMDKIKESSTRDKYIKGLKWIYRV